MTVSLIWLFVRKVYDSFSSKAGYSCKTFQSTVEISFEMFSNEDIKKNILMNEFSAELNLLCFFILLTKSA